MARIPYLDADDLPVGDRDLLTRSINLFRVMAHSPNATRAIQDLGNFIRHRSRLDPRLRELAILQVGYLARSPYEFSHHIKIGKEFGVSDYDIKRMINENNGSETDLEPVARSVLQAAREMTLEGKILDESFARLAKQLSNELIVDLILTISFYNGVVRLLAALEVDVENEYFSYLCDYPLPVV
ncbi:MAG TPA: carboxymuconolactone decarboxylase family protein [Lacipirellulaceae bacterium]|nr:carboxymuconolactone decarboxylase family protein [Lacipirellulaceae bacterium]